MYLIFIILAVLLSFSMLTWTFVTACRILFPEEPLPLEQDPAVRRARVAAAGARLPVGTREIREDQRRRVQARYTFATGISDGLPPCWQEDLRLRRN